MSQISRIRCGLFEIWMTNNLGSRGNADVEETGHESFTMTDEGPAWSEVIWNEYWNDCILQHGEDFIQSKVEVFYWTTWQKFSCESYFQKYKIALVLKCLFICYLRQKANMDFRKLLKINEFKLQIFNCLVIIFVFSWPLFCFLLTNKQFIGQQKTKKWSGENKNDH